MRGSILYGDVLEAKRFNCLEEIAQLISDYSNRFYLGFNVILIPDVTFERIKENNELYDKYHDPNYAIR